MDVTIDNFKEVLDEFDEVIQKANFFSIDSEFTGMNNERTCPYSTPSELYKKICSVTDDYIIIQLGITAFRVSPDDPEKLLYRSYNFYVYPQGRDQDFKCTGSNMVFLAEQNFDFNKLFRKGISCCTREVAEKYRKQIDEKQKYREDQVNNIDAACVNDVPVPLEEQETIEEIRKNIQNFLISDDKKNYVVDNCNAFQRKLVYQLIEKEFREDVTAISMQKDNLKTIAIERKITKEEEMEIVRKKNEEEELDYFQRVGLSTILEKISASKKLIVGHNMFLDLFYIIRQFFEDVPESLKKYKERAHKIFPNVLDTKHLTSERFRTQIPSSVLPHIYDAVQKPPFSLPTIEGEGPEYSYTEEKEHEAGYDSYITGVCLVGLAKDLNINISEISPKNAHIRNFLNKIFVMRLTDIYYINLTGNETIPNRDHVFHISFPLNWKQSDIVNHFRKFGSVFIRWINQTSAYVALNNRENSSILLDSVAKVKGVRVITFEQHSKETNQTDGETKGNAKNLSTKRKANDSESEEHRPSSNKMKKIDNTKEKAKMYAEDDEWPQ